MDVHNYKYIYDIIQTNTDLVSAENLTEINHPNYPLTSMTNLNKVLEDDKQKILKINKKKKLSELLQ